MKIVFERKKFSSVFILFAIAAIGFTIFQMTILSQTKTTNIKNDTANQPLMTLATGRTVHDITTRLQASEPTMKLYFREANEPAKAAIQISTREDCVNYTAGACYYGEVIVATGMLSEYESGEKVTVAPGINGTFYDFSCGASCSSAWLRWKEEGYYYSVAHKAGSKDTLLRMAQAVRR